MLEKEWTMFTEIVKKLVRDQKNNEKFEIRW